MVGILPYRLKLPANTKIKPQLQGMPIISVPKIQNKEKNIIEEYTEPP